jgi:hypothetical protein
MQHHRHAGMRKLPCSFRAGEATAYDVDGFRDHPGKLGVYPASSNLAGIKTPATGAGVLEVSRRELALLSVVPRHPHDVGAADADIGKLAVAQAGQFVQAAVVAVPGTDQTDKIGKHSGSLSLFFDPAHLPVTRLN